MEHHLTEAEQLYRDHRYEEALAAYEQAIRLSMPNPDPRLYYGRAAVLEQLAQQAYDTAKRFGYREDEQGKALVSTKATLSTTSLQELAERCRVEIGKYSRKEACDDQYCLEIFRRAMLENNERAWEILHQRFNGILLSWVRCHPNREAAYRCDSENSYVDRAFRRLWMRTKRNAALEFSTLDGALGFLRMCLNSDIADTLRSQLRPEEMPWPEPGFPEEPAMEDTDESNERWKAIESVLPNPGEQRLAYMLYYCNLKPRQIVQLCPDEFSDVNEIFRLTRTIVDRLRRNKDRLRWLLSDADS